MPGFSMQGKVQVAERQVSGQPGLFRWIGNATVAKFSPNEKTSSRNESFTGSRLPFRKIGKGVDAVLSLKFDEWNVDNLAWMVRSAITNVAAGSAVTNYPFPSGAVVGNVLAVPHKNLSALVIKDNAAGTLVAGTNYIADLFGGQAELINLGAFVQPFKADYTGGLHTKIGALNRAKVEYYVRIDGFNTDDLNKRVITDCFRVDFDLPKDLDWINEDFADFTIEGTVKADATRAVTSADGNLFSTVVQ